MRPPHARRRCGSASLAGAAVCIGAAALAGCASAVMATAGISFAQAGASAFIRGELVSAERATLDESWAAAVAALEELAFDIETLRPPEEAESQGLSAYVSAKDPGGPRVKVKLERASDIVTLIRIRIDLLGEQALSRLVLSRIEARLSLPEMAEGVGQ